MVILKRLNNLNGYREKERIRQQRKREKIRKCIIISKSAGCKCGEKHPSCLQFHHIDPSTKTGSVSRLISEGKTLESVMKEIEKCELICANCHAKQHWNETRVAGKTA